MGALAKRAEDNRSLCGDEQKEKQEPTRQGQQQQKAKAGSAISFCAAVSFQLDSARTPLRLAKVGGFLRFGGC